MLVITLPTRIKKAFRSIRLKFLLAYLLIVIIAFSALTAAVIQLVGECLFTRESEKNSAYVESRIAGLDPGADAAELYARMTDIAQSARCRVLFLYENSVIQLDTLSLSNGQNVYPPESGLYKSEEVSPFAPAGASAVDFHTFDLGNKKVLVCAFSADELFTYLYTIGRTVILISLILIAVSVLVCLLVTRSITAPINDLNAAISALSAGDFTVRAPETGNNELTDLAHAFNDMAGRIETLDRSRNQFVSNASHELKTPLTSIKALAEFLLYQEVLDETTTREFLNDINSEIDRLANVVNDLLTLVGMDSGEVKLKTEVIDLTAMLKANVKRLSPIARNRGIELELNAREDLTVMGDVIKLDQVFYNLIDNAIKYTPRRGRVDVEILRENKNAVVHVRDTGIGIPEADQKHIFDRFYRVDKARSRETGGTGLGLSIVKQIALLHGGNITLESKVDAGSDFAVTLPLHGRKQ